MATINAIDSNIPIQIALGGTNTTSFTNTDGVVYFDGTELNTTTVGTAGQVLTSNGAAVAPTFQAVTSGGMVLLSQQPVSNVASVAFTSSVITSTYTVYLVIFTQVQPATNNDVLNMNWSVNNGSGYLSSGFSSGYISHAWNSATWANTNSTTTCPLTGQIANTSYASGYMYLYNLASSIEPQGNGQCFYNGATVADIYQTSTTTSGVNNIQFICAAGNVTGLFTLYGLVN